FGAEMRVVDTGGLDPDAARDVFGAGIHRQALRAIGEADALLLVVDGRAGLVHEFYTLGLAPYAVSAAHGRGIDALLEAIANAVGARRPEPVSEGSGDELW